MGISITIGLFIWLHSTQLKTFIVREFSLLPGGSDGKESACNAGDPGLITGLERSAGDGKGYPLQYSGLENSMDCPWGRKGSDAAKQLSFFWCTGGGG